MPKIQTRHVKFGNLTLELQVCPMWVVVGQHVLEVGYLNMRAIDADVGCDEDEVNLLAFEWRKLAELMPSVGGTRVIGRHVIGIIHFERVSSHRGICLVILRDVEVARYNGRLIAHNLLNLLHDELGTLTTSLDANMVEVCVDSHEDLARLLVLELGIAGNTLYCCVPTLRARHIGRFAQPEITFLEDLELIFQEEDRRVFSTLFTIVTPYPNIVVFRQTGKQVLELNMENLLHTHDFDVILFNIIGNSVLSNAPSKAGSLVAIVLETDVEGAPSYLTFLCV